MHSYNTVSWHTPAPDVGMIESMVQPGRAHSRIYTDERIFQLEIDRIFSRTWVYVGHESEVPNVGDFKTRVIGRTSVIMVRGKDAVVRLLVNRCRHRGSQVCETDSGNTKVFRCSYHGWIFHLDGELADCNGPEAYEEALDPKEMGLTPVPRADRYRGFVFGSLASDGESLTDYLGGAARMIDLLCDASPTGAIIADGGTHKTVFNANWKLVGMDGYHPNTLHASVVAAWGRNPDGGLGTTHRESPFVDEAGTRTRDFGHGHVMLDFRGHRIKHYDSLTGFLRRIPGGEKYIAEMHAKHGEERARLLISLAGDAHLGTFPNMQLIHNQIRIITPISASKTEVTMMAVRLDGVSDEMNTERFRQQESFYGPAGAGSPDDSEIFERVQRGMVAEVNPWIQISRGMGRQKVDTDGSIVGLITDEVTQRGILRYWKQLMTTP
jgi:phenylpropionate dioxygenase-like ring-hydroxylating dioxygenase large terminal subunit